MCEWALSAFGVFCFEATLSKIANDNSLERQAPSISETGMKRSNLGLKLR